MISFSLSSTLGDGHFTYDILSLIGGGATLQRLWWSLRSVSALVAPCKCLCCVFIASIRSV